MIVLTGGSDVDGVVDAFTPVVWEGDAGEMASAFGNFVDCPMEIGAAMCHFDGPDCARSSRFRRLWYGRPLDSISSSSSSESDILAAISASCNRLAVNCGSGLSCNLMFDGKFEGVCWSERGTTVGMGGALIVVGRERWSPFSFPVLVHSDAVC
jgi:hypothetical protein